MANLFDNISDTYKDKLLKLLEANTYSFTKDMSLMSIFKSGNMIGIVTSGFIQIIQNDYYGNRRIIEDLEENSIFGTMFSQINNDDCDIIIKEDAKIIIIDYKHIINTANATNTFYNQFIQNLLQILSDKINEKNNRIEILSQRSIRNKLLEYFRIISKKNGSKNIYLPFSFTQFADYLAVDRCAMSRELHNLKNEGFIAIKGKRITLLY